MRSSGEVGEGDAGPVQEGGEAVIALDRFVWLKTPKFRTEQGCPLARVIELFSFGAAWVELLDGRRVVVPQSDLVDAEKDDPGKGVSV